VVDKLPPFLGLGLIHRRLDLRSLADRLLQGILELGELLVMLLRLVPVTPEHVEVVLGQIGALFLDLDGSLPEDLVLGIGVLLRDLEARLSLDASLLRVVDAAGEVAMRLGGARGTDPFHQNHGVKSSLRV